MALITLNTSGADLAIFDLRLDFNLSFKKFQLAFEKGHVKKDHRLDSENLIGVFGLAQRLSWKIPADSQSLLNFLRPAHIDESHPRTSFYIMEIDGKEHLRYLENLLQEIGHQEEKSTLQSVEISSAYAQKQQLETEVKQGWFIEK